MESLFSLAGYIVPFLIVLTIVVFFHELGHFLVARWNKVKVEAFSVGFGPELFGFNDRHGTRWKLCAVPLGGYVKFLGDANAASAPDFEGAEAMTEEEREGSFVHKRVGQRAAVVVAGPVANFILAIVIFSLIFMTFGRFVADPVVGSVDPGMPAAEAGIMPGDVILSANGTKVENFVDLQRVVAPSAGREVDIVVRRDGKELTFTLQPRMKERVDRFGNKQELSVIGIQSSADAGSSRVERAGPVEAVGYAVSETWFIVSSTISYLGDIVTGRQSTDQLGGPIRIAKVSGEVATLGPVALLNLAAVLSVSIGLLNLFPIPLLDGGHLVFYAIEAIRGRPLGEAAQEIGYRLGLALVLLLMFFATFNDITQIFLS